MATDSGDYDEIIRPIEDQMMRSIWRIVRSPDDAEDALQEALSVVWKRLDRIRRHDNPRALVLRICIDAAYDVLRKRMRLKRHGQTMSIEDGIAGPVTDAHQAMVREEKRAEIERAIARLSRSQATAILMRCLEGQDYRTIGAALGCSEATARTHVVRARKRLCALLWHLRPSNSSEVTR